MLVELLRIIRVHRVLGLCLLEEGLVGLREKVVVLGHSLVTLCPILSNQFILFPVTVLK